MTGKVLGQFFTLPLVKDLMVKLVNPSVNEDGTVETLFDPAMGTAGFLMSSICHIQKQAELKGIDLDWKFITEQGFGGREAEPSTFQLAKSNLLISSGHLFSTIEQGDSIRDPITNKYDIVLANPPFGIKGLDYQEITSHLRNEYMPIESKSAVPLFLQVCISILKVGGRCAMVMPDGQELFGKSKGLIALREYLMKTCDLKEIYFFPPGVFTNTSIKTCVVYFHKKKEGKDIVKIGGNKTRTYKFSATHQTKKVKFYDYNPYEKVKNLLVEVDVNRLAENGYSLNYAEYLEEEEEKEENEGVEWKTLGEIFDFKTSNLAVGKCSQSGEYMFVSSSDINTHNQYTLEGDNIFVLKVFDGAKNKSYKTKFKYYSGKCSYSNLLYHMKPKITIIPKFFYYILANDIDNISVKYQKGSCNKSLNLDLFQKYKIPIPSLSIQQATIEKLDFLYERDIEGTKRKIEELKLKRDMIVENATIGVELKTLGEVCEINPESMKKNEWDTINYIDISSVGSGSIIEIKEILDNFPSRAKRKIKAGDTIYSTVRPNLCTYAYIERDIERGIVSTGFAVIRPKGNLIGKFISYIISQPYISDFLSKKATGAQYPAVSTDIIKSITIPIPPLAIQQATVEQCERLERLISSLEQEIKNSKELAKVVLEKSVFGSKPISEENSQVQIVFEDEQDNIIIVEDSDEDD
jgi:restriction endonuclease S subunit